jgi:hypothetical protein
MWSWEFGMRMRRSRALDPELRIPHPALGEFRI